MWQVAFAPRVLAEVLSSAESSLKVDSNVF